MPRTPRHLLLPILWGLATFACVDALNGAVAQGKTEPPAGQSKQPPAQPKQSAAPNLVAPTAESTLVLIRSTLLRLDDALKTGNYTVLRDLGAPSFREANTAGRLHEIFGNLSAQRIDMSTVAILAPKLPQPPTVDQNGRLRISGNFPGDPVQLNFDLAFEAVAHRWRLFGISVNLAKSGDPEPSAATSADERKPQAQQAKPTK